MTAEIVNLRRARKHKQRSDRETAASANRAAHGRSAEERTATGLKHDLETRRIEGHRRTHLDETDREDSA